MTDKPNKSRRVRKAVTAALILFALLMLILLLPVCVDCGATRTYIEDRWMLGKIGEKWDKVRIEGR